MTDGIPQAAIEAAYAEFCRVYPQRCAPWDQLAEWERDRFRLVLAAAVPLIRAEIQHEHQFRHCDDCKSAPGPCACAGQPCCQAERDEIAALADAYEHGRADERQRILGDPWFPGLRLSADSHGLRCLVDAGGIRYFSEEGSGVWVISVAASNWDGWRRIAQDILATDADLLAGDAPELDPDQLRIEVYRDTGHGLTVPANDVTVRITHLPTGLSAVATHRSALTAKATALKELRALLTGGVAASGEDGAS